MRGRDVGFKVRLGLCVLTALVALTAAHAAETALDTEIFAPERASATDADVTNTAHDPSFQPFSYREARRRGGPFWLKLTPGETIAAALLPAITARGGRHLHITLFAAAAGKIVTLPVAAERPEFRGVHELVFVLPQALTANDSLYARVELSGSGAEELAFSAAPLAETLARGAAPARMIAAAFGALMAMALAALLIWLVLPDSLFILYATLFGLQAVYIAYLSGQAFSWPLFSYALPLNAHAWNVPAALGGAVSCLFVREITDLKHFSARAYRVFGWLASSFVLLSVANLAKVIGVGSWVANIGNALFLGTALFTVVVVYMAWRRGSRAAGLFLIAWALLVGVTITTAASLLFAQADPRLIYYAIPLSMVAAAVLVALSVADRLREQQRALTEAERRAQTDSLTGVLNRRSLIERLDAACLRAQARALPIALLFIDLDHFKAINDSFGHSAGDACLVALIAPIQAELRQSDVIGRFGGEEFVVLLSSADAVAARAIAERIRQGVADLKIEGFGAPIRMTCSIGVATSDTLGVWGEHFIAHADSAVYAAKSGGRNQVQIAALSNT
jgi:diguanylate cyclase (GGDEF)-like protein